MYGLSIVPYSLKSFNFEPWLLESECERKACRVIISLFGNSAGESCFYRLAGAAVAQKVQSARPRAPRHSVRAWWSPLCPGNGGAAREVQHFNRILVEQWESRPEGERG